MPGPETKENNQTVLNAKDKEAEELEIQKKQEEFEKVNVKLYEAGWKSNFYSSVMHPLTGFAGNLGYIFVIIAGAFQVKSGNMGIGGIQAFVQYVRRFNMPIQEVANISNVFQTKVELT